MRKLIFYALFLLLAGCAASTGTYTLDETKIPSIQDDVTTKAEITALFGQPQMKNEIRGQDVMWIYHTVTGGADSEEAGMKRKNLKKIKQKMLTIYFKNDIVISHYYQ